jgi:16S rRNA U516 pseudouridylate synthase RsuA-like enzyme
MPRTSKIIPIPRPAPGSFNKHRRAGTLLLAQAAHLQKALIKHHAEVERLMAIDLKEIVTEFDVSEYARRVTALLHPHHARHRAR